MYGKQPNTETNIMSCQNELYRIEQLENELAQIYDTGADNIRKARKVFDCLRHVEFMVQKCPICGAKRDEDGIIVHKKKCYLADTLFGERK